MIFRAALEEARSFLSRGCAESYAAADECFITNQDTNGLEYTCVSSCDTNGCNTGTRETRFINVFICRISQASSLTSEQRSKVRSCRVFISVATQAQSLKVVCTNVDQNLNADQRTITAYFIFIIMLIKSALIRIGACTTLTLR